MGEGDFITIGQLGKGSFGTVQRVSRKVDRTVYALKKVKMLGLKMKDIENALKQARFLASLNHPNIISYKQAFIDNRNQHICIVLQYADKGDIQSRLKEYKNKRRRYTQPQIWRALNHIASGLSYLHSQKLMHRDIKAANIFICASQQGNIYKIGDFNVSKMLNNDMAKTQTGTPFYCSPQVWRDQAYDYKSDIYSLGCLLYQMAAQVPPFQAKTLQQLFKKVMKNQYISIPKNYSPQLNKLIRNCLNINPKYRPSAFDLYRLSQVQSQKNIPGSQRPRAKSYGTPNQQMLGSFHIRNKNTQAIRHALPAPRYQPIKQKQQKEGIVKVRFEQQLVLPRLSTQRQRQSFYSKSRTQKSKKSQKQRPKTNRGESGSQNQKYYNQIK